MSEQTPVVKMSIYGAQEALSAPTSFANPEEEAQFFALNGIVIPPYAPESLCNLYERSAALRPNVEAYAVNIEAFGYRLTPTIDLEASDSREKLRDAIMIEKMFDGIAPLVTEEEIDNKLLVLKNMIRLERLHAEFFFNNICSDMSFVELRERTRTDLEVTGNAYWEVLRDRNGKLRQVAHIPSVSMRLMQADNDFTEIEVPTRISPISIRMMPQFRRFRRCVQYVNAQPLVYFKEIDDPRVLSKTTGRYYESIEELERSEPNGSPANEVIHFKIHSPSHIYGIPRWIGASLAVVGNRSAEEVNVTYFDNKAVPPMAILVSGGTLAHGVADRITRFIGDHLKGRENFHSILVLEAEAASNASISSGALSNVKIELKSLFADQQQDALFQTYDANNNEKIGNQFRLPRLLRGNMSDFNRATAQGALQYAEQQVFQPERNKFDYLIDRRLLPQIGVRFHEFLSNAPDLRDPETLVNMIAKLVDASVITVKESRELVGDAFNVSIQKLNELWCRLPPKILAMGIQPAPTPEEQKEAEENGRVAKPVLVLTASDSARVVTVNEARQSMGLDVLRDENGNEDPSGNMSVSEFEARNQARTLEPMANAMTGDNKSAYLRSINLALESNQKLVGKKLVEDERAARTVLKVPADEWESWFEKQ